MAKKNPYEKKAQKKELLEGIASDHAKGSIKHSALETGRDMLLGAVGGGLAGAVMGRSSFLVGIAVTGVGHFMGSGGAAAFGVGMMASGGYQAVAGAMNGTPKKGIEGVKERMTAFAGELKHKLFLDTIIKPKKTAEEKTDETTNGMGEVQYFNYPQLSGEGDIDLSELERFEKKVADSAKSFEAKQSAAVNGTLDVSEQNF